MSLRKYLEQTLKLNVQLYTSSEDCLTNFAKTHPKNSPFCLVNDISLEQGSDGLLLIDILKDKGFEFVSIVMTGFASIETAIAATKKGVFHYLTKPFELENHQQSFPSLSPHQNRRGSAPVFFEAENQIGEVHSTFFVLFLYS